MEMLKVLSIDIGIVNLGYVYSEIHLSPPDLNKYKAKLLNNNYLLNKDTIKKNIHIIDCNRVDITRVIHKRISYCSCKLHHDNCIPDYLDHFIQETPHFQECDVLIIERQPPIGITNVQDLLFKLFRDKVLLVSPGSVHKYFNLPRCEYDIRKEKSKNIAEEYLSSFGKFTNNIRKHDIADAMLMILFYYKTKMETVIDETKNTHEILDFEQFRFKNNN
jgi:hypothetical protein